MQSSTGQYSTQAGDPAQPVQHSVITASSFGFFLRGVVIPLERGSCFNASGTIPAARGVVSDPAAMLRLYSLSLRTCEELSADSCSIHVRAGRLPFANLSSHANRPRLIQFACRETVLICWSRNTALCEKNPSVD